MTKQQMAAVHTYIVLTCPSACSHRCRLYPTSFFLKASITSTYTAFSLSTTETNYNSGRLSFIPIKFSMFPVHCYELALGFTCLLTLNYQGKILLCELISKLKCQANHPYNAKWARYLYLNSNVVKNITVYPMRGKVASLRSNT